MPEIRSAATTFNIDYTNEIIRSVSKLAMVEPRSYALMGMLHSQGLQFQIEPSVVNVTGTPIGVEIVSNPKFEMQRDELEAIKSTTTASAAYDATTINVADGALFPKYALVYVPRTGEIFRVSSVSSNALTVIRATSGTTGVALVANEDLIIMDSAYAENQQSGDISFHNTTFDYNYTQISREPYGNSRTEQGTMKYGIDNSYDRKKKMALIKLLRRNNGTMWLGGRSIDTTNTYRTTGGVLSFIDTGNVYDVNGSLTQAEFEFWMRKYALAYNNTKKTLFAGSKLIERINSWAAAKQISTSTASVVALGLSVNTYRTAWGEIDVVYEPYFDEITSGSNPLSTYGVALDLSLVKLVYFVNGVLQAHDDIQENDRDGRKGEWLMEFGVKVDVPKAHAVLRGV